MALRLDAEIVSLDSMTVYREMDIGTAKPTADERRRVPHHLLDLLAPTEEFSLSNYVDAARQTVAEIRGRGQEVLFVGGTPLYLKSLLRGIFQGPPADWEFRQQVEGDLQVVGLRRPARATAAGGPAVGGQAASPRQAADHPGPGSLPLDRAADQPPADAVRGRHAGRAVPGVRAGLAARSICISGSTPAWSHVRRRVGRRGPRLLARYGALGRTAAQAVGYREVLEHLDGQRRSADETIDPVKARTRQFARRQETWFRSLSECRTVSRQEGPTDAEVAEQILQLAGGRGRHEP